MFVNEIIERVNESKMIMDIDTGSMKVCIKADDDEVVWTPIYSDGNGNDFIVVGSVYDTNGYVNEYGGAIMMDLIDIGIHLADVIIMPEFIGDTWYSVELDEWEDLVWVAHNDVDYDSLKLNHGSDTMILEIFADICMTIGILCILWHY